MSILQKRINELLYEHRLTQSALAEKIGITQPTLSRNLSGIHAPRVEVLESIAKVFDVSVDYLLGVSDIRNPDKDVSRQESLDDILQREMEGVEYALFGEVKDLTDEQKEDLLQMVKLFKKNLKE